MMQILLYSPSGQITQTQDLQILQKAYHDGQTKIWVDLEEPSEDEIDMLFELFHFHSLSIEELLFGSPAPKLDFYERYAFLVLHRFLYNFETAQGQKQEFEIFFSDQWIISHHCKDLSASFAAIREKIILNPSGTLGKGTAYILVRLLELSFKDYQSLMDAWLDKLESVEENVLQQVQNGFLNEILALKKIATMFRKTLLPQREVILQLYDRNDFHFIPKESRPYLKKAINQVNALLQNLEALRENAKNVFEVYVAMLTIKMTESSNKLNYIMQRLTIAATIFMPLTFIVGVYGMNIDNIPELQWKGFYFALWGFMIALVAGMVYFFKKKKWI